MTFATAKNPDTAKPITLEEFLDYDNGTDFSYELVDGVPLAMPVESWDASTISIYLLAQLLTVVPYYRIRHKDTEIAIPGATATAKARIPDLMVVSETTAVEMTGQKGLIPLQTPAPVLVIEVVSPGVPGNKNYDRDYIEKRQEYAARGIPEYWLIDPQRRVVLVLTLVESDYQAQVFTGTVAIRSTTFPGLSLTAEQILQAGR